MKIILLDNNQLVIASLFQSLKMGSEINKDVIRHLVLNTYRIYRNKFHSEYGELVICHDGGMCWRNDIFSNYKANRSKKRKNSDLNWDEIHQIMDDIYQEIKENFPYKNIKIRGTEADDIIAILCKEYYSKEKLMIVSSDKDFKQLQKYSNVFQFSPLTKKHIVCEEPDTFLVEHIIKGDASDGIPNILSDDDTFVVEGKRQKSCGKLKIEGYRVAYEMGEMYDHNIQKNWIRNEKMINFEYIPENIRKSIIEEYEKEITGSRNGLLDYFINNKLKQLISHIEEF